MKSNPFFFGKSVSGSAFIDRRDEILLIESSLERGQSVIIFSPRRYGKTSLIKQVIGNLDRRGVLVFYVDLYRITTMERFATVYSQTVLNSLHTAADKIFSLVRTLVPSLRPKLTYSEPNLPSIELELSMATLQRQSTLSEMLNLLERYCEKKHLRGCVVFDEFQEITTFDSEGLLEREMRSAFQHHESVSYAFLGSKTHLMQEIFKDKNRPFYNFGSHIELDTIAAEHWMPFIEGGFRKASTRLPRSSCEHIVDLTQGHPYYTQMLCSEAWELAMHQAPVPPEDLVGEALQGVLNKENHAFVEIWDSLTPRERKLLTVLADVGPAPVFSADFLAFHRLGSSSTMQRVVQRLTRRGILVRGQNGHDVSDPIFVHWIRREDER